MSDELKDDLKLAAILVAAGIALGGISYAVKKKLLRDLEKADKANRDYIAELRSINN